MPLNWQFSKAIVDGDPYEIDGLNIWAHHWRNTQEYIHINDPIYGEPHTFTVWEITAEGKCIRFAAGEFSNCVWGIYLND